MHFNRLTERKITVNNPNKENGIIIESNWYGVHGQVLFFGTVVFLFTVCLPLSVLYFCVYALLEKYIIEKRKLIHILKFYFYSFLKLGIKIQRH